MELTSDDELAEILDSGDSAYAYPHHYKEQPGMKGKLLWLSGAPGLGKSTSAMLLARKSNYVCFRFQLTVKI